MYFSFGEWEFYWFLTSLWMCFMRWNHFCFECTWILLLKHGFALEGRTSELELKLVSASHHLKPSNYDWVLHFLESSLVMTLSCEFSLRTVEDTLVELTLFLIYFGTNKYLSWGCWWVVDLHSFQAYLIQQLVSSMPNYVLFWWYFHDFQPWKLKDKAMIDTWMKGKKVEI